MFQSRGLLVVSVVLFAVIAAWASQRAHASAAPAIGRVSIGRGAVGAPILQGDLVVVPTESAFVAHDIRTGAKQWTSERCDLAQVAAPVGARSGSRIVISCGAELRLLDLDSGEYLWRYGSPAFHSMLRIGGGLVAVGYGSTAKVLDLDTGKVRFTWRPKAPQQEALVVTAGEDTILIAEDEVLWAFEPDGTVRWHRRVVANSVWIGPHGVVIREPSNLVTVVDLRTGKTRESSLVGQVNSSYAMILDVQNERVLVARDDGNGVVYGLNSRTGGFAWSTAVGDNWTYVTHGEGHVMVANENSCEVRDLRNGRRLMKCPRNVVAAALDRDRVAYVLRSSSGAESISVKRIPA